MKKDKALFPFGQLPVMEKGGKVYAQSFAILKLLGVEYGYFPTNAEEIYLQEVALEALKDIMTSMLSLKDIRIKERKAKADEFLEGFASTEFSAFEAMLKKKENKNFWSGEKLTVADFGFAIFYADHVATGMLKKAFDDVLDQFPTLDTYMQGKYAQFKEYFEKRPVCPY